MDYNKKCIEVMREIDKERRPTLLLHACCAPCSSSVLERLSEYFQITILFYNPNITDEKEYEKRKLELEHFLLKAHYDIKILPCSYDREQFLKISKGLESQKEGEERCYKCYQLRLEKTAQLASKYGFDFFTTTLSISPYKNAKWLNEIGQNYEVGYSVKYLYADFKKQNGYQRSIELSRKYQLYRQDYCGCIYSKLEREQRKKHTV